MKFLVTILLVAFPFVGFADDLTDALKRYADLKELSKSIRRTSSPQEVESVLGRPISKGIAGWNNPDVKVWDYFKYTDDARHLSFSITFDPEKGCAVSHALYTRETIEKGIGKVNQGIVRSVLPNYNSENGFYCIVEFDDGLVIPVIVNTPTRVTGSPEEGVHIRIEHHGIKGFYNFVGHYSLILDSIRFSKVQGKQILEDR